MTSSLARGSVNRFLGHPRRGSNRPGSLLLIRLSSGVKPWIWSARKTLALRAQAILRTGVPAARDGMNRSAIDSGRKSCLKTDEPGSLSDCVPGHGNWR